MDLARRMLCEHLCYYNGMAKKVSDISEEKVFMNPNLEQPNFRAIALTVEQLENLDRHLLHGELEEINQLATNYVLTANNHL